MDESFEMKSTLEVYDTNLSDSSLDMKLLGTVVTADCFHSVAWGSRGMDDILPRGR